ncbi:MAG: hypothetical protein MJ180_02410 [Candidatus Gastranaerophilales bacterium]|nr:hypothetical protein [Candidatus Gastranaerophilales bacterium]
MEQQLTEKKSKRIMAVLFDEIKRLEGMIMENPSLVASEYIAKADKSTEE